MIRHTTLYQVIPRHPRWLNKLVAGVCGYYWIPCPLCGNYYAGYEWIGETLMETDRSGTGVCYKQECQNKTKRHNEHVRVSTGCTE